MLQLRALSLLLLVLTACGGDGASSSGGASAAQGTWVTDAGATTLELKDGGTFEMNTRKGQHITGNWTLDGAQLSLKGGGAGAVSGTFNGRIVDGKLELEFGPTKSVYERR